MDYHRKSYDSLAKAAEEIFNRNSEVEADPEPLVEADVEEISEEELEESTDLLVERDTALVDMIKYSGAVGLFAKKVAKVITDDDEAALFPTGMITRDGVAMQEILLNYMANRMGTDPKQKFGPYFDRVDLVGPGMSGKTALRGALDPRRKYKIKDLMKALKTFKEGVQSQEETLTEAVEHTFKVTAPNSKVYVIDGEENPTLELERGKSYVFELDASGHPFMIKNEKTGGEGDQYNDGVTNNGAEMGMVEITVSADAPDELYYICSYHPLMCGILKIKG